MAYQSRPQAKWGLQPVIDNAVASIAACGKLNIPQPFEAQHAQGQPPQAQPPAARGRTPPPPVVMRGPLQGVAMRSPPPSRPSAVVAAPPVMNQRPPTGGVVVRTTAAQRPHQPPRLPVTQQPPRVAATTTAMPAAQRPAMKPAPMVAGVVAAPAVAAPKPVIVAGRRTHFPAQAPAAAPPMRDPLMQTTSAIQAVHYVDYVEAPPAVPQMWDPLMQTTSAFQSVPYADYVEATVLGYADDPAPCGEVHPASWAYGSLAYPSPEEEGYASEQGHRCATDPIGEFSPRSYAYAWGSAPGPDPKPMEKPMGSDIKELLDTLETRIDLMATMQQTRHQVEQHVQNCERERASSLDHTTDLQHMEDAARFPNLLAATQAVPPITVQETKKTALEVKPTTSVQNLLPQTAIQGAQPKSAMQETQTTKSVQEVLPKAATPETSPKAANEEEQPKPANQKMQKEGNQSDYPSQLKAIAVHFQQIESVLRGSGTPTAKSPSSGSVSDGSGPSFGIQAKKPKRPQGFHPHVPGMFIEVSEDGLVARRTQGCRQGLAFGSAPLEKGPHGYYFEIEIVETVAGWVGGLGIGVTHTAPTQLRGAPGKARWVPKSFVAGYSGSLALGGREWVSKWNPENLKVGQRVGFLLVDNIEGDMVVYEDDVPVVRTEGILLVTAGLCDEPLYPIVDVTAATKAVKLVVGAKPPLPPVSEDDGFPIGGRSGPKLR